MVQPSIRSPLTLSENVVLESCIAVRRIIDRYRNELSIDISHLVAGLEELNLYRCLDTGLRFFGPEQVAGDEEFYRQLQHFDWYYMPWKWEHRTAASYLDSGEMHVLEVGCGRGDFVEIVGRGDGVTATGLEMNGAAVQEGRDRGVDIRLESVEEHAAAHAGEYDLVCSFQVLEHVANVRSFLDAQVACLRPGGRLIISVPNNDSFLRYDENILNIPPHHMGWWDESSLRSLERLLPLRMEKVHLEPLQPYHRTYFTHVMSRHMALHYRVPRRIASRLVPWGRWALPKRLKAFTIQAVYQRVA
jgi:SAM-dependent methyltransferase